jgi:outer membrane protein assembly factor BamB
MWKFLAASESTPVVSDGVVYVGGNGGLLALDAGTGKERWRFNAGEGGQSSPAISKGVAYFGSSDSNVYAVDTVTGKETWAFRTGAIC